MRITKPFIALSVLLLAVTPVNADQPFDGTCENLDRDTITKALPSSWSGKGKDANQKARNYLVFNHAKGRIEFPVPAQLEVRDGEAFVIVFACSNPSQFDYVIEAIKTDKIPPKSPTIKQEKPADKAGLHASVSWRHSRFTPLYQVSVKRRATASTASKVRSASDETGLSTLVEDRGAAERVEIIEEMASLYEEGAEKDLIERFASDKDLEADVVEETLDTMGQLDKLYSYTFPVWVKTVGWRLSFSSGIGFSDLVDEQYFVKTDSKGTPDDTSDDLQTVERDTNAESEFLPDLMALANLRFPSTWGPWRNFGLSFGLGIGDEAEPRYFFGPSFDLGKQFVLTAGVAGGKVATLPTGQVPGEAPINGDNTLNNLPKKFETAAFVGIAFRFSPAEKEFLGALTGAQKIKDGGSGEDDGEGDEKGDGKGDGGEGVGDGEGDPKKAECEAAVARLLKIAKTGCSAGFDVAKKLCEAEGNDQQSACLQKATVTKLTCDARAEELAAEEKKECDE